MYILHNCKEVTNINKIVFQKKSLGIMIIDDCTGKKILTGEHGMKVRTARSQHHLVGWHLHTICHKDHITQLTLPIWIKMSHYYLITQVTSKQWIRSTDVAKLSPCDLIISLIIVICISSLW